MSQDESHSGSSTGMFIIALVLVLALLGGLVVIGLGGLFVMRTSVARQQAVRDEAMAVNAKLQAIEAQQQVELLRQQRKSTAQDAPPAHLAQGDQDAASASDATPVPPLAVHIDTEGVISVDDRVVTLAELRDWLHSRLSPERLPQTVEVLADKMARFGTVSEVLSVIEELKGVKVRIRTWERTAEAAPRDVPTSESPASPTGPGSPSGEK